MGPRGLTLLVLMLTSAGQARAAGGAHVVDDSEGETAGLCHVETWLSLQSGRSQFGNAGVGCTSRTRPNLELGASVSYIRMPGADEAVLAIAPKYRVRPVSSGLGLAVDTAIGFSVRRQRIESASLVVPLSIVLTPALQLNVNAGGNWARTDDRFRAFTGAQLAAQVRPSVQLMAEGIDWSGRALGGQAGVRWTVDMGRIDLDLLAARYADGVTRRALTIGVTIRR